MMKKEFLFTLSTDIVRSTHKEPIQQNVLDRRQQRKNNLLFQCFFISFNFISFKVYSQVLMLKAVAYMLLQKFHFAHNYSGDVDYTKTNYLNQLPRKLA